MKFEFEVIDPYTGERPDPAVCGKEEWASNERYCKILPMKWSYAIDEDGVLIVADACGNYAYPPEDRFQVNMKVKE